MTNSFRLFKELLLKLSKSELNSLKKCLKEKKPSSADRNKSIKLLRIVLTDPDVSMIDAEKEIYGLENRVAFEKLIERAIEKIDEQFILFDRDALSQYSERNYYYFLLKRKLAVLQMRWLRGIDFNLGSQFDKIITLSRKYELNDVLIETLYGKQRYVGFRFGKRGFKKIESEIEKAEINRKAVLNARRIFTNYTSKINRTTIFIDHIDDLNNSIRLLEEGYKFTKSPTIAYYLLLLQVAWFEDQSKLETAERILNKLLNLVVTTPSIYTRARHGDSVLNLAINEIRLSKFHEAIINSINAQTLYQKNSESIAIAMETEFLARFFNKEIKNSENIIEKIYLFSKGRISPFLLGRRAYFFACVKTIKGEFERSNELLLEAKELDKDKAGWNLGIRVLSIINQIELENYENAELKVLSMEKYMKRISKTNFVRKRDKAILRILLKLINENFDFKNVYKERKKYFDLLVSNDPDYSWKIKSHEMIVFHDWFKGKLSQVHDKALTKAI